MSTLAALYKEAKVKLSDCGLPAEDALELLEAFTPYTRNDIYTSKKETDLSPENERLFLSVLEKRCKHYPLQYILGYWYFRGMKLKVGEGVLCPRDDTEVLVMESLRLIKFLRRSDSKRTLKGLDLCSGTGCIALSIADEAENTEVSAVELYEAPLICLNGNITAYGNGKVKAVRANVLDSESIRKFTELDFIVSNPPYIKSEDMNGLQEEVKYEPEEALTDFSDGLTFYRFIISEWKTVLKSGGFMAFEIDDYQAEDISQLLNDNGFHSIRVLKDLGGLNRCVSAIKK